MHSIAEEMGAALRRTSISPNIIERRDYSCAVFDAQRQGHCHGRPHAGASRLHAHVGQSGSGCSDARARRRCYPQRSIRRGNASSRHHAGASGVRRTSCRTRFSMLLHAPIMPTSGARLPAPWARDARYFRKAFAFLLSASCVGARSIAKCSPSSLHNVRTPVEREGDLVAQIGACRVGERRLHEVVQKYGLDTISALTEELLDYSDRLMRAELRKLPAGTFTAEDFLDDDGSQRRAYPYRRLHAHSNPISGTVADRLCRFGSAGGRQRQCGLRHHLLRLLLRPALPAGRGCAGHRRA